jgi:signal transduction histidine kinase
MRFKAIILFITITTILFPQAPIDSINKSISSLEDSVKARILLEETWKRRSNDPLTAIQLGKEALKIYKHLINKSGEAKANNYLGITYTNIGAIEVAFEYHKAALLAAEETGNSTQIAYSYNNIGEIYRTKNNVVKATENIQKAIQVFESIDDKQGLAYCFVNLGRLYAGQDDFNRALELFENAKEISLQLGLEDMHGRILLAIARIAQRGRDFYKAEQTYFDLEKIYHKTDYQKGIAGVWRGLSEVAYNNKKFREALDYSLKSLDLNKRILNAEGEVNNLNQIAKIYLAQNNIKAGERYLSLALKKSEELNSSTLLASTYKTYYQLYKQIGRLDSALYYHEKYYDLKDLIVTKEEMIKLGELESLIKIEKTERENEILQKDLENQTRQRNYLIIISLLFLLLAIGLTVRYIEKKRVSEKLNSINIVKDKFFRIIAHDLREPFSATFTALGLLKEQYNELSESEQKEAIEMIGSLIKRDFDLLENLLLWAKNQRQEIKIQPVKLPLKPIISKILKLIETSLTNKNISVNISCPEELAVYADDQMFNTIMRNIIFNAVKFTSIGGKIKITAEGTKDNTIIKIIDNGVGMDRDTVKDLFVLDKKAVSRGTAGESGSGLGMILVKEFVDAHKGTIQIESEPGSGTTITIILPRNNTK